MPATFLTAEWRDLLMLNYVVDPALLEPHLPSGVELDPFQAQTLVSLVGFRFLNTRVLGLPIPFHRNFDEVNLRFYVVRRMPGAPPRRGVCFIREFVPRYAIAFIARTLYHEPYAAVPMRHELASEVAGAEPPIVSGWEAYGTHYTGDQLAHQRSPQVTLKLPSSQNTTTATRIGDAAELRSMR
jgi:uncharacterized protein